MPDTQISDEMVERAAEAIFTTWAKNRSVSEDWVECTRLHHSIVDEARDESRAALTAALAGHVVVPREPTGPMIDAGLSVIAHSGPTDVYRAMIDAAQHSIEEVKR